MSAELLLAGAVGFLLGAIPFSWLLPRIFGGVDIRAVGSRNVGATNVARSFGYGTGVAALLLDAAKGAAAVVAAGALAGGGETVVAARSIAGGCAVLGHSFTPFLRFRGGKGVATGAGVFAALAPMVFLLSALVFLVTVLLSRLISLGSVLSAAALPILVLLLGAEVEVVALAFLLAALVIVRHRSNLVRIVRGTEPPLGGGGRR